MCNLIKKLSKSNGLKLDPNFSNKFVVWEKSKYKRNERIVDTLFVANTPKSAVTCAVKNMQKEADKFLVGEMNSWLLEKATEFNLKGLNPVININNKPQFNSILANEMGLMRIDNTWVLLNDKNIVIIKETYVKEELKKVEINKEYLDLFLKNYNYSLVIALCSETQKNAKKICGLPLPSGIKDVINSTPRGKEQIQHIKEYDIVKYTEWAINRYTLDF